MPDIFMHFVFRRWFTHRPAAPQPPGAEEQAAPLAPPKEPPARPSSQR